MHFFCYLALLIPSEDPKIGNSPRKLDLTVERCVQLALQNNPELSAQAFAVEASFATIDQASGTFDPFFTASATYSKSQIEPQSSFVTGSLQRFNEEQRRLNVGVGQTVVTGGSYNLTFGGARSERFPGGSGAFLNPSLDTSLQLTVSQPLLRGGWSTYATAPRETARLSYEQQQKVYESSAQQTIYNVHAAYWDLVFAQEDLAVKRFALSLAEKLLDINQKKVKEGVSAPVEVLQAETQIAIRKQDLITAENNLKSAQDSLRQLIFPFQENEEWELILAPTSPVPSTDAGMIPEWDAAITVAALNRPDLHRIQAELRSRELAVEVAENELNPNLDVTATTSSAGLDSVVHKSLDDVTGYDFPAYSIGLNFRIPFGNVGAKGKLRAAEASRSATKQSLRAQEKVVARDVRDAIRNLQYMKERIAATQKSRELAQRQLEAEERKFEVGLTTNYQVLQFQQELVQALTDEKSAQLNHAKAIINLQRAQGTLRP